MAGQHSEDGIGEAELRAAGFQVHAAWVATDDGIALADAPREAGVYVFLVDGHIAYVGKSNNLHRRFGNYRRGDKSRLRLKHLIQGVLAEGRAVSVLVGTPGSCSWNGLPVDLVDGLEAGLIRSVRPSWNKAGV